MVQTRRLLAALLPAALAAAPLPAQLPPAPLQLRPEVTVLLQVADLPRSQQFFQAVLGARTAFADPAAGLVELALPGGSTGIALRRGSAPKGGAVLPIFHVADLAGAQRTLAALKVEPLGPAQQLPGLGLLLRIADPDGNQLQLLQPDRPPRQGAAMLCAAPTPFAKVLFLCGTWRSERDGTVQEEVWTAPAGTTMHGQNRTARGDELSDFELLRIAQRGDDLYYEARPRGGKAVAFRLVEASEHKVVFANPSHDFPRRISYWLQDGQLCAEVDDGRDGGRRLAFRWSRVP